MINCTQIIDCGRTLCGEEAIVFELSGLRCHCIKHYKQMKWVWDIEVSEGQSTKDEVKYLKGNPQL